MAGRDASKESNTKSKKRRWKLSDTVIVAVIGAFATIIAALIPYLFEEIPITVSTPETQMAKTVLLPNEITDTKGVTMRLVPAGEFNMGSKDYENEKPIHKIYLDAYYIDKYEVTNTFYELCVDMNICAPPWENSSDTRPNYFGNPEFGNYPVIHVDWNMAKTFCEWRNAQLPTEAQWEKAARGTDGRTYSWGEGINENFANFYQFIGDTAPVGSYENGKSPYDVYDMVGNVWEWVADWYSDTYFANSPLVNPLGPDNGQYKVLKGGSWYDDSVVVRPAHREGIEPTNPFYSHGFRCVITAP